MNIDICDCLSHESSQGTLTLSTDLIQQSKKHKIATPPQRLALKGSLSFFKSGKICNTFFFPSEKPQ